MPLDLITPHGDREPGLWFRLNQRDKTSLPLMGIGNLQVGERRQRPDPQLITPHGDRELARVHGWVPALLQLITPHGDRELLRCRRDHRHADRAHYPSWGSGTRRVRCVRVALILILITPHGDRERTASSRSSSIS